MGISDYNQDLDEKLIWSVIDTHLIFEDECKCASQGNNREITGVVSLQKILSDLKTRFVPIGIGEYGIGKLGIGKYRIGEHGIGEHGIGEHGIGKHGIGEHGIGEHGNVKE